MVILNIFFVFLHLLLVLISSKCLTIAKTDDRVFLGSLNDHFSDEGELAEVKYLTKEKGDYHIIQIKIPSFGIPFSIHLIRTHTVSPNLRVHHGGITETELDMQNCFYFGRIVNFPGGKSALSDCGDQEGFNGHILVGKDHFVIEPASIPSYDSADTNGKGKVVLHKVFRPHTILERENTSHSDMLIVPKDKLQKSIEEQQAREAALSEEIVNDNTDSLLDDDWAENELISESLVAKPKKTANKKINTKKNNKNKKNIKNNKKTNKKMPNKKQKGTAVDISVFTDEALMTKWQQRLPKNTKGKMKLYILNLVNNMNLLYQQPSLGTDIVFRLVYIEMLTTIPPQMKSSNWEGKSSMYLESFCKYSASKNANGAKWDHALLLSGLDLAEDGDTSIAGMAFFQTMCIQDYSCSVSEGTTFGVTFIVTHEMGHSLGMAHDGKDGADSANEECDENTDIMSPWTGEGKVRWSSCSTRNIKDFLSKGSSWPGVEDMALVPVCLNKPSSLKTKAIPFSKNKLPGEIYSAKIQCQYDAGKTWSPYTEKADMDVCRMLWCRSEKQAKQAHPALEGTSCGSEKVRKMCPETKDAKDRINKRLSSLYLRKNKV